MRGPGLSGRRRRTPARGILIAGTTSDAGKSFVTTGLCRLLVRRGWAVAPFKAANMSLNAVAADDGGEMASAQWVQCRAAGFPPLTVCNPILYKSSGRMRVEVIVRGRTAWRSVSWARTMPRIVPKLRAEVRRALTDLLSREVFIVAEGAGSPAEVNLRKTDLSNLDVARTLDAPVLLIADLERGGAVAQVIGTLALLTRSERNRVRGIIFNRMAGDSRLLRGAIDFIESRTGVAVLGVLPYLPADAGGLPAEDSLSLVRTSAPLTRPSDPLRAARCPRVRVGILRLPHVSNFSDFMLLEQSPLAKVTWVTRPRELSDLDALILPGTRRTVDDLAWLRRLGWPSALRRRGRDGLRIAGFCGGYQILGNRMVDPKGFEGSAGTTQGLHLLPLETTFLDPKLIRKVRVLPERGNPWCPPGCSPEGFEIRRGRAVVGPSCTPLFRLRPLRGDGPDEPDGAVLPGGKIWGTAVHGLLNDPGACEGFVRWAGVRTASAPSTRPAASGSLPYDALDGTIDHIADLLERNLDLTRLGAALGRRLSISRRSRTRRPR
jgi:adenosylcobyric acid synthase